MYIPYIMCKTKTYKIPNYYNYYLYLKKKIIKTKINTKFTII